MGATFANGRSDMHQAKCLHVFQPSFCSNSSLPMKHGFTTTVGDETTVHTIDGSVSNKARAVSSAGKMMVFVWGGSQGVLLKLARKRQNHQ